MRPIHAGGGPAEAALRSSVSRLAIVAGISLIPADVRTDRGTIMVTALSIIMVSAARAGRI